jgi:hypothetical protein
VFEKVSEQFPRPKTPSIWWLTLSKKDSGRGMKRCRDEGRKRFELRVGAAVLANNLMRIAALLSE